MQWNLQSALTQALSQESKFETFIKMHPAINGTVFSLGDTNLCYFENMSSSSAVGQDKVTEVEEIWILVVGTINHFFIESNHPAWLC